jgi:hypothetical protein
MRRLALLVGSVAALGLAVTSRAALLTFDFTGADAGASSSFTTTSALDPHLTLPTGLHYDTLYAGQSDPGSGAWIGLADPGVTGAFGIRTENGNAGRETIAAALLYQHTFSFTIAPAAGYEMNLSGAQVAFTAIYANGYWGPDNYPLFTSIGGIAAGSAVASYTSNSGNPEAVVYTLPATGYDHLTGPLTLTFAAAGGQYLRDTALNALSIASGTVTPIPEPTTGLLTLAGLGAAALSARRRRS